MKGLMSVFHKELADHFTGWRGIILFIMILMVTIFVIMGPSGALMNLRAELTGTSQYVFIKLFTTSGANVPSFIWCIAMFLVPIIGIVLGLDAINSERNNGTMSRLLAQPIYRDAVINGKFLAGIVTIAIMLTTTILVASGIGMATLGVPPSSEELTRLLMFWGVSILYGAFWLGLAMLFSVYFKPVASSAVASLTVWIFFFFYTLTGFGASQMQNPTAAITAMRVSPLFLFQEAISVITIPGARTLSEILQLTTSSARFIPGPLSPGQTLLTIWPHLATIGGITALLFAISYVKFMREEVRST